MIALFIVGAPATGKTELARCIMQGGQTLPWPKWTAGDRWCAVGHYDADKFQGGDTIPNGAGPEHFDYWAAKLKDDAEMTIIDGNRFAAPKYIEFMEHHGAKVFCVLMDAPASVLNRRRLARGSKTTTEAMKAKQTIAERFAALCPDVMHVDATRPTSEIAASLIDALKHRGLPHGILAS